MDSEAPEQARLGNTIVEALLNFVTTESTITDAMAILEQDVCKLLSDQYPIATKLYASDVLLPPAGVNIDPRSGQPQIGFLLKSADGNKIIQLRNNGFSISKLRPYDGWDKLAGEAVDILALYSDRLAAFQVLTIGTRYLNFVHIPSGQPMEKYLTCYPQVGPEFPQVVLNYRYVATLPLDEKLNTVTIGMAPIKSERQGFENILLDLDFTVRRDVAVGLREQLSSLRKKKNDVYWNTITAEMRELLNASN